MDHATKEHFFIRLFIGCPLTSELRMHLKASKIWKQEQIQPTEHSLVETHHAERDYIGCYSSQQRLTLPELNAIADQIRTLVLTHCPKIPSESLTFVSFPQLFFK